MLKKFHTVLLLCLLFFFIIIPAKVEAAKKFIPKKSTVGKFSGGSIPAVVRFRPDRLGILMSFTSFSTIGSVSYSFTYSTNGVPQGAGGTISSSNNPTANRELLFGTCSTGVCTYHNNITNAKLVLTAKYTNGNTATKTYRIKTRQ